MLYENEIGVGRKQRILKLAAAFPHLLKLHIRPRSLCHEGSEIPNSPYHILLYQHMNERVETRYEGDKIAINREAARLDSEANCECWVDKRELPWCFLSDKILKHLSKVPNRPLWICNRMARELVEVPFGPNFSSRERLTLLGYIDKLTNAIGQCERIHKTAVPLNYARHSLRSLTLWLFTLPFALIKDFGLLTGPVVGLSAWLLFGVYQIGYMIEDPFQGTLRLSTLCNAISRDVLGESTDRDSAFTADSMIVAPEIPSELINLFPNTNMMESMNALGFSNATWSLASA
jgi:predicted membrane chloride channel (bestrophin family)